MKRESVQLKEIPVHPRTELWLPSQPTRYRARRRATPVGPAGFDTHRVVVLVHPDHLRRPLHRDAQVGGELLEHPLGDGLHDHQPVWIAGRQRGRNTPVAESPMTG